MPYQTGTTTSASDLKSIIETFAAANGWVGQGAPVVSYGQGLGYFQLTAVTSDRLRMMGGNGVDGSGNLTGTPGYGGDIWLPSTAWPATYHLFAHTNPVGLWCVVNYANEYYQWLGCGDITKYGAWTGGNWAGGFASSGSQSNTPYLMPTQAGYQPGGIYVPPAAPFYAGINGSVDPSNHGAWLHCELDGAIWPGNGTGSYPLFASYADPLHQRMPSIWNSQSTLTPYWLWLPRSNGYGSILGHIEHLRSVRVDNYTPGDIITLGTAKWKVFPWWRKDTAARDGGNGTTGTWGFALAYDGP